MSRSAQFSAAMRASESGRPAEAVQLMAQCAKDGDPVACYLLAFWFQDGEVVPVDKEQSERWMREMERLAESGNPEAQWELGQSIRFGNLFQQDIARANHWLERAAENGWGDAQHHLAWFLQAGLYGYPRDLELSEKWYRRAFEREHPETLYFFALREFKSGQMTDRAKALLLRAAEKGFMQAAHVLHDRQR